MDARSLFGTEIGNSLMIRMEITQKLDQLHITQSLALQFTGRTDTV